LAKSNLDASVGVQEILNVFGCQQQENSGSAKLGNIQTNRHKCPGKGGIEWMEWWIRMNMNFGPTARRPIAGYGFLQWFLYSGHRSCRICTFNSQMEFNLIEMDRPIFGQLLPSQSTNNGTEEDDQNAANQSRGNHRRW
jgi:hypothetical protein